jgi:hypothetical protein
MTEAVDRTQRQLTDGSPVTEGFDAIDPRTGQQRGYVCLTPEERAKGFVRPVRTSYVHVGPAGPTHLLQDLTEAQRALYADEGYVKYEVYPASAAPSLGRFWTQADLDAIGRGCQTETTMGRALAETYARDPGFYGGTFCCACRKHLPVGEFVWAGTTDRVGS